MQYTYQECPTLEAFANALYAAARFRRVFLIRGQLRPELNPAAPHRRKFKLEDPERTLDGPPRWWGV